MRVAAELVLCGCRVSITDRQPKQAILDKIQKAIAESENAGLLGKAGGDGPLQTAEGLAALERLTVEDGLPDAVRKASLVVDAAPEDLDLKVRVFTEVLDNCRDDALITTGLLGLRLTDIQAKLPAEAAHRLVGLRFLAPVVLIPVVELDYPAALGGRQAAVVQATCRLMESIGKHVFECPTVRARPGVVKRPCRFPQ